MEASIGIGCWDKSKPTKVILSGSLVVMLICISAI